MRRQPGSINDQERRVRCLVESDEVSVTAPQDLLDIASGTVTAADPHGFRGRSLQKAELMKIGVL